MSLSIADGHKQFSERPQNDMRRKSAFKEGHFWENIGLFLFMAAGLVGLWYVMTNIISW